MTSSCKALCWQEGLRASWWSPGRPKFSSSGDGSASSSAVSVFHGLVLAEVRGDAATALKGQQVMSCGIKAAG